MILKKTWRGACMNNQSTGMKGIADPDPKAANFARRLPFRFCKKSQTSSTPDTGALSKEEAAAMLANRPARKAHAGVSLSTAFVDSRKAAKVPKMHIA